MADRNRDAALLLIAGAWHGPWLWEKVMPVLMARGWNVQTMDLPTSAADPHSPRAGFYDDAAAIHHRIKAIDGPVVVVAHSYGAAAATQGAANLPNVRHLVSVCGFQLDVGESLLGLIGSEPDWWVIVGDTVTVADPEAVFFHDLPKPEAERAVARMTPFSTVAANQALTTAVWHTVSSTYIVCDHDHAFVEGQKLLAQRATRIRYLPSSHSPMLSMPGALTDIIEEAACSATE